MWFRIPPTAEVAELQRRMENAETVLRLLLSRMAHPDREWAETVLAALNAPELTGPVCPDDRQKVGH